MKKQWIRRVTTAALIAAAIEGAAVLMTASAFAAVAEPAATAEVGSAPVVYVPANTKVAVLPVINASGEKDRKQRIDQVSVGNKELAKQFRQRGFLLTDASVIAQAIADQKIDLNDEENWNRANLYRIGEAAGADLIAFVVIDNVDQKRHGQVGSDKNDELASRANIKIWLLDVKSHHAILSAVHQEAQAKNPIFADFDSGSRLIRKSVEGAIRDVLKDFLRTYPNVAK